MNRRKQLFALGLYFSKHTPKNVQKYFATLIKPNGFS